MKLSKTYIANVDRYISSRGMVGILFESDGMAIATNGISLIIFTPFGDDKPISVYDLDGIKAEIYPYFKKHVWKLCFWITLRRMLRMYMRNMKSPHEQNSMMAL